MTACAFAPVLHATSVIPAQEAVSDNERVSALALTQELGLHVRMFERGIISEDQFVSWYVQWRQCVDAVIAAEAQDNSADLMDLKKLCELFDGMAQQVPQERSVEAKESAWRTASCLLAGAAAGLSSNMVASSLVSKSTSHYAWKHFFARLVAGSAIEHGVFKAIYAGTSVRLTTRDYLAWTLGYYGTLLSQDIRARRTGAMVQEVGMASMIVAVHQFLPS